MSGANMTPKEEPSDPDLGYACAYQISPSAGDVASRGQGSGQMKSIESPMAVADSSTSSWRQSRVDMYHEITKTNAMRQYRLSSSELELWYRNHIMLTSFPGTNIPMEAHMYNERDVERLAWEKHGGPEAWDKYLQSKCQRYAKRYPGKSIPRPWDWAAQPNGPPFLWEAATLPIGRNIFRRRRPSGPPC